MGGVPDEGNGTVEGEREVGDSVTTSWDRGEEPRDDSGDGSLICMRGSIDIEGIVDELGV